MRRDIITAAKRIKRKLRGNISFESAERYIKSKGYSVICCNDSTDEVKRFGLVETLQEHPAITYQGDVYMIFINRHYTYDKKLRLLLHEMGHIILGHLEESITPHEVFETDADVFAHVVYHTLNTRSERKAKSLKIITCVLSVVSAVTTLLIWRFAV